MSDPLPSVIRVVGGVAESTGTFDVREVAIVWKVSTTDSVGSTYICLSSS